MYQKEQELVFTGRYRTEPIFDKRPKAFVPLDERSWINLATLLPLTLVGVAIATVRGIHETYCI